MRHLDDETLLMLELEGAGDAELRGHLAACPDCEARRQLLRADLTRLSTLEGEILAEPAPVPTHRPVRRPAWPSWLKMAALLAAAFIGGGTGVRYLAADGPRILPYVAPAPSAAPQGLVFRSCPVGDFEVRLDTLREVSGR